jgi:7-cyano-7-deazaguanine synthase in queuosine biosynthesis
VTQTRLRLHSLPESGQLTTTEFLWRRRALGSSSFNTKLDPELLGIGDVPLENRDVVALAIGVFLSDRTVPRSRGWERDIELIVPVYRRRLWHSALEDVVSTLEILTSDRWTLDFVDREAVETTPAAARPEVDVVSLFSGGADSLCGAVQALTEGKKIALVSHWDWAPHSKYQRSLAGWLARRFPDQLSHYRFQVQKTKGQLDGTRFPNEPTRRSRSLLFIALGTAVASVEPAVPLLVPENGYSSLNPPLAGERRGSLSTRTTHPLFLSKLQQVMHSAGAHADFSNPFESATKGEMFGELKSMLGAKDASRLLALSHSCAHARWAVGTGLPPQTQCGVCYGCLVRRAAFAAADLPDGTTYLHTSIPSKDQPDRLRRAAQFEVRTVQYAVERGIDESDILAVGLPEERSLDGAVEVVRRGLDELRHLITTAQDLAELE